jgi:hypothetical protein
VHFFADDLLIFNPSYATPILGFGFEALDGNLVLLVETESATLRCPVGLKGQRLQTTLPNNNVACTAVLSGAMPDGETLNLEIRWLESCRVQRLSFHFAQDGAQVISTRDKVGGFDIADETAILLKQGGTYA